MSFGIRRRARKADQYVQIDNAFLRDTSLSIEARGMGAYLLTHSEGFRVSAKQLGIACGTGRDKTRRLVAELEAAGYLVREAVRESGRFTADEFSMSDEKGEAGPVTENPSPVDQSPENAPHKKTNSEKTKKAEDQLSEGTTADAAPAEEFEHSEDDVKLKPPADAPALFEVAAPPKPPASPSCKDVVGAYVDSFRAAHQREPLRRDIGRVAREAKGLLDTGEATFSELMQAAQSMGGGQFSNIGMQVKINRGTGAKSTATPSSLPSSHEDPRWAGATEATLQQDADLLAQDPDLWASA